MLAMVGWVGLLLGKDEPLGSGIARTFLKPSSFFSLFWVSKDMFQNLNKRGICYRCTHCQAALPQGISGYMKAHGKSLLVVFKNCIV